MEQVMSGDVSGACVIWRCIQATIQIKKAYYFNTPFYGIGDRQ